MSYKERSIKLVCMQARLIALYYDTGKYTDALALGAQLLKELKKLDDKHLLVEVLSPPFSSPLNFKNFTLPNMHPNPGLEIYRIRIRFGFMA